MTDETPKKRRGCLPVLLLIIVLIIAVIVALPWILSNPSIKGQVLAKVNQSAPGEVQVEDWSFKWGGPQTLTSLTYTQPDGLEVTVEEIEITGGLLDVASKRDAGEITLLHPVVLLPVKTEKVPKSDPSKKSKTKAEPAEGESSPPAEWPNFTAKIKVVDGQVSLLRAGAVTPVVAALNSTVDVDGTSPKLSGDADILAANAGGRIASTFSVQLQEGRVLDPNKLTISTDIELQELDLETWLALAEAVPGLPSGSGQLNGKLLLTGQGADELTFSCLATGSGVELAGGPFGTDTPNLDPFDIQIAGTYSAGAIQLKESKVNLPFLNGTGQGGLAATGAASGNFNVEVNLPELFRQLPNTIKVKEGLTLDQGLLTMQGEVSGNADGQRIKANLQLNDLNGSLDGATVSLDEPITVNLEGTRNGTHLRAEHVVVQSSFLKGRGQGDLDKFACNLTLDLARCIQEAGQFIELGDLKANGSARLSAQVRRGGGGLNTVVSLMGQIASLEKNGKMLWPRDTLQARFEGQTIGDEKTGIKGFRSAVINLQSKPVNADVNLKELLFPTKSEKAQAKEVKVVGSVSLADISPILFADKDLAVEGECSIDVDAEMFRNQIILSNINVKTDELSLADAKGTLRPDSLSLVSSGVIDLDKKSIDLARSELKTKAGSLVLDALQLQDWSQPTALDMQVGGQLDLAALASMLNQYSGAPAPGSLQGDAQFKARIRSGNDVELEAQVDRLVYTAPNSEQPFSDNVSLNIAAKIDQEADQLICSKLELKSSAASIVGQADITDLKAAKRLSSNGTIAYDLENLNNYLSMFGQSEYVLKGKSEKPYQINCSLAGKSSKEILATALGQIGLYADEVQAFGLVVQNIEVPVSISNGFAQISVSGNVNEGRFAVAPQADFTQDVPVMTMATNALVLDHVNLTGALADQLLAKIHPIFKGSTIVGGKVSLTLTEFNMPAGPGWETATRFAGVLDLHEVKLGSSGILDLILEVARVSEREHDLGDRQLTFVCENGKVTCSPISIKAEGYEIKMHGDIGLDQSLSYKVDVPVNEKMVSSDVFEYVQGASITVPLTGTVSKPKMDKTIVQKNIGQLSKQAAGNLIKKEAGKLLEGLFK